jgi:hypothetical protein
MKNILKILTNNLQLILIVILAFCLLKSCKQTEAENEINTDSLIKSNSNLDFKNNELESQNTQIIEALNSLSEASKQTERILYRLQQKTSVQPLYVADITDCNDTIQQLYSVGLYKDSLCNNVIATKDSIILKKDDIIGNDSVVKSNLKKIIENKDLTIESQDKLIVSETKKTRSEARKKTFWQILTAVLTIWKFAK